MINTSIATKDSMGHAYTISGKRVALTKLKLSPAKIVQVSPDKLTATVAYGLRQSIAKPQQKMLEKVGISENLKHTKQFSIDSVDGLEAGNTVTFEQFTAGDIIQIESITKGRGFTSVVKLWHFRGGPKTHGQSDRHRAPGAISSGQTLGRVFKGRHMARRSGNEKKTIKNLRVLHVDNNNGSLWISGSVPGSRNATVFVTKTGHDQKIEALQLPQAQETTATE